MINTCLFGDARDSLRKMIDAGIKAQMCVTSPPYFGLRAYLPDDHADKARELGAEKTPDEYVANLVEVFRLVRDVLSDDGVLWLNLGDSYANDGKWGGSSGGKHVTSLHGNTGIGRGKVNTGCKPKDLIGIPWRVAFALQADGWTLRSDIIWNKKNVLPESVKDRPTRSHEYVFLLSKAKKYFYDADAIKEDCQTDPKERYHERAKVTGRGAQGAANARGNDRDRPGGFPVADGKRNRRSVWTIATRPYSGAHFAAFPPALVEPCILAGSRPGDVVLDPFIGSGTTAQVAEALGRRWIGCDIDERNAALHCDRLRQAVIPL